VSTQLPLQLESGAAHTAPQEPAEHESPEAQLRPHIPQLRGSFVRSTHCPLHTLCPPPQRVTHMPAVQVCVSPHA
jgi:hypothetical protein